MRFHELPLGGCFAGRGKIHRKNGPETYLDDSVGPEVAARPGRKVRAVACPIHRTLIELGNVRKKR